MPSAISAYGKLRIRYHRGAAVHTASVNISVEGNSDPSILPAEANALAARLASCMPPDVIFDGYDILNSVGAVTGSGPVTLTGATSHITGGQPWESITVRVLGHEVSPGLDGKVGRTSIAFHTWHAYVFTAGTKVLPRNYDDALEALCSHLETTPGVWAGFHGIKANVINTCPVQFNAHTQRKLGS